MSDTYNKPYQVKNHLYKKFKKKINYNSEINCYICGLTVGVAPYYYEYTEDTDICISCKNNNKNILIFIIITYSLALLIVFLNDKYL
jgi:hypothetical protein